MKRRLRKKLQRKEFFEPFFEVSGVFKGEVADFNSIIDDYEEKLYDLIDSIGVEFYGNFSGGGFYTTDYKDPLTKAKMQKIFNFFDKMYLEGKVLEKFQFHNLIDTYEKYLQWEKDN